MFKFNKDPQKSQGPIYKLGQLIPVYPAQSLLGGKPNQVLLNQVNSLSLLPEEQKVVLYEGLIHRFVEWVQVLPTGFEERLSGLMNEGLLRSINSLSYFADKYPESTALERYAVFSAALLLDVGKLIVNQKIFITDEKGNFLDQWNPFVAPLTDLKAEFYRIMPFSSVYQRYARSVTPLLAQQLLPREGYIWLSSNLSVFFDWLEALQGEDGRGVGALLHLIQLIKRGTVNLLFKDLPFVTLDLHLQEASATAQADDFLIWLKKGLKSKQIKVNVPDAGIYIIPEGVFLDKTIFKHYAELVKTPLFLVYQQFGNLFGLTKLSGADYRFEQLFSESLDVKGKLKMSFVNLQSMGAHSIREGILISNPNLIFENASVPSPTPHFKLGSPVQQRPQNLPAVAGPVNSHKPSAGN